MGTKARAAGCAEQVSGDYKLRPQPARPAALLPGGARPQPAPAKRRAGKAFAREQELCWPAGPVPLDPLPFLP